jgi:GMP synthase (glutamine-hydrolysing)
MHLHYLKHVPFEGLGSIRTWAEARNFDITVTRFYADDNLPELDAIDCLFVMGGPMNIYEDLQYPWLCEEKKYIRQAIKAHKKVLGICLGAQLIADVLGARVYANAHKEIGWFPVIKTGRCAETLLANVLPAELEVLHWHGDTFDMPKQARRIARSAASENQGFVWHDRVVALQFHLETTPKGLKALIDHCGDELVDGRYIQKAKDLLSNNKRFDNINQVMQKLLDRLVR